jgi:hypothetical protein
MILELMCKNPGTRFKAAYLATHLGLGRERTAGLLSGLQAEGKVVRDGNAWFVATVNGDIMTTNGKINRPAMSEVQAWLTMGRELFGCPIKVTVEVL